jgi:hypothetical protein
MKKIITIALISLAMSSASATEKRDTIDTFTQTDKVLSEVVKKALMVAEKTGEFVIEQAPLLLQEFYNWHIVSSIFFIILFLIIAITCIRLPYLWLTDKTKESSYDSKYFGRYGDEQIVALSWCICVFGVISAVIGLFTNIYDLVFILIAPKLYLIEYFIH